MDEVDAFLDFDNVQFVTRYMLNHIPKTQKIVISHKEDLASESSSLIGVCMQKQHSSSKAFSVDLKQFDEWSSQ